MKLHISEDEAYPVYDLYDADWWQGDYVEVDEEFYKEYLEVNKLYDEMQDKLSKIYDNRKKVEK